MTQLRVTGVTQPSCHGWLKAVAFEYDERKVYAVISHRPPAAVIICLPIVSWFLLQTCSNFIAEGWIMHKESADTGIKYRPRLCPHTNFKFLANVSGPGLWSNAWAHGTSQVGVTFQSQ